MREPANRRLIIVVAAEPRPPALFTGPLGQGNNMKALTIHRARSPGVYGHLILVLTRSLHRSPGLRFGRVKKSGTVNDRRYGKPASESPVCIYLSRMRGRL